VKRLLGEGGEVLQAEISVANKLIGNLMRVELILIFLFKMCNLYKESALGAGKN
jgi:hypothetical protein